MTKKFFCDQAVMAEALGIRFREGRKKIEEIDFSNCEDDEALLCQYVNARQIIHSLERDIESLATSYSISFIHHETVDDLRKTLREKYEQIRSVETQ